MASWTSMLLPSECFCLVFWTRCCVVVTNAVNCHYFHRTRPGTTERTGWRLPNWILPSFLSCLCWLKVRAAYWMTSYCLINLAASTVSLFFQIWRSRRRATRHLSTRWSILRKWWGSEFTFFPIVVDLIADADFIFFGFQRMIANTVKILRYCRSQPFSKSTPWNPVSSQQPTEELIFSSLSFCKVQIRLRPARAIQMFAPTYASST